MQSRNQISGLTWRYDKDGEDDDTIMMTMASVAKKIPLKLSFCTCPTTVFYRNKSKKLKAVHVRVKCQSIAGCI